MSRPAKIKDQIWDFLVHKLWCECAFLLSTKSSLFTFVLHRNKLSLSLLLHIKTKLNATSCRRCLRRQEGSDRQKRVKHHIDHHAISLIYTLAEGRAGRAEGSGGERRLLLTVCRVMLTQTVKHKVKREGVEGRRGGGEKQ